MKSSHHHGSKSKFSLSTPSQPLTMCSANHSTLCRLHDQKQEDENKRERDKVELRKEYEARRYLREKFPQWLKEYRKLFGQEKMETRHLNGNPHLGISRKPNHINCFTKGPHCIEWDLPRDTPRSVAGYGSLILYTSIKATPKYRNGVGLTKNSTYNNYIWISFFSRYWLRHRRFLLVATLSVGCRSWFMFVGPKSKTWFARGPGPTMYETWRQQWCFMRF